MVEVRLRACCGARAHRHNRLQANMQVQLGMFSRTGCFWNAQSLEAATTVHLPENGRRERPGRVLTCGKRCTIVQYSVKHSFNPPA